MTNDEIRKNDEARMTNFGLRHLAFFRHSTFGICHWPGFVGGTISTSPDLVALLFENQKLASQNGLFKICKVNDASCR
jgi:hypothetical protein